MKVIRIKKNKLLIFSSIFLTFIITFCTFSTSFGMQHYYKLDFSTCIVTASKLNVRSGPGTGYSIVATVNKNDMPTAAKCCNGFKGSSKRFGLTIA